MNQAKLDQIEVLPCGSVIQHGHYNNRIYLMKAGERIASNLPIELISIAEKKGYSKIFAKLPLKKADCFFQAGFTKEAVAIGLYDGSETGVFLAYYLQKERAHEPDSDARMYEENKQLALKKKGSQITALDTSLFLSRACDEKDITQMANVYKIVFSSYPFPIFSPDYLCKTMRSHIDYFAIFTAGKIIALSSAEIDRESFSAEMTDFATLPEWRGNGFSVHLLKKMEESIKSKEIKTVYTITRSASLAMNITFAKLGYDFGGRLKNNTNISGKIESMNVWYKPIEAPGEEAVKD